MLTYHFRMGLRPHLSRGTYDASQTPKWQGEPRPPSPLPQGFCCHNYHTFGVSFYSCLHNDFVSPQPFTKLGLAPVTTIPSVF